MFTSDDMQASVVCWMNPFTGKVESWSSNHAANREMFMSAARRIQELQADIDAIKAQIGMTGVIVPRESAPTIEDCYALTKPTTGK